MKASLTSIAGVLALWAVTPVQAKSSKSLRRKLAFSFEDQCTALIGVGLGNPNDPNNLNSTFLACMDPSNGYIYTVDHACKEWVAEEVKKSTLSSNSTKLSMLGATLVAGTQKVELASFPPALMNGFPREALLEEAMTPYRSTGFKTVLGVRVETSVDRRSPSFDEAALSDALFGTGGHHDHLAYQMAGCSRGKLQLQPATGTGITDGVTSVLVGKAVVHGDGPLRIGAISKLLQTFGVSKPTDIADFIILCMPQYAIPQTGYSFVDSYLSVYNDTACLDLVNLMHYVGYNLNLGPAAITTGPGQLDEYGDKTGAMGLDFVEVDRNTARGRRCYNGPKTHQLGWFQSKTLEFTGDSQGDVSITLLGLLIRDSEPGTKIIKFDRAGQDHLYLTFNWMWGYNGDTQHGPNEVVLAQATNYGVYYGKSRVLRTLGVGDTWDSGGAYFVDTGCHLKIDVVSIDSAAGKANVLITGCPDIPTPPPSEPPIGPTPIPTPPPTEPPTTLCKFAGDLCLSAGDCCVDNQGQCVEESTSNGMNSKLVCRLAGAEIIPPDGECNDNGVCEPGENCMSCVGDCNALLKGPTEARYCCEGGPRLSLAHGVLAGDDARCKC